MEMLSTEYMDYSYSDLSHCITVVN